MNGFPAFHSFCIVVFQFSIVMIIIVFIELVLGIVAAVAVNKVNGDNGVVSFNITKDLMHDAYEAFYGSATDTKERQATRIVWNLAQKQGVSQALFIIYENALSITLALLISVFIIMIKVNIASF